jgi:hypothetical protein
MIGVMHEPRPRMAMPDRHAPGRQDQLGAPMVGHRPTDHAATEHVHDHRQEEKTVRLVSIAG